MKKVFSIFLSFVLLFSSSLMNTFAASEKAKNETNVAVTYLEDGSYIITSIIEEENLIRASGTKSGQKKMTYCNSDNEVLWTATVKGTFSYNGSYGTCTSASISYSVSNSNWKISSATATATGNKAIGKVTAKKYVLGILVQTVERSVTLSCSANGTLS